MESHGPEWWHLWQSNKFLIFRDDFLSRSSEEEINIKVTASRDITEDMLAISIGHNWRLGIGVSEEDAKELGRITGLDEAEWMHTLKLPSSSTIIKLSFIFRWPHGPCSLA